MSAFDCIIWDWNGTLIDDLDIAVGAVNDTLDLYGMPHIGRKEYYSFMRSDIRTFYSFLFDYEKVPYETLTAHFSRFYDERIASAHLMKNAEETLKRVKEKGVLQVIVSASHIDKVVRDTAHFAIDGYFDEILAASDNLVNSKIDRAAQFLKRRNIQPNRALVVGDLLHDMEMAQAIGAQCVLIPNGHQPKALHEKAGAAVLNDISMVPDMI